ncbi:MAG: hypothetical protein ACRC7O_14605 [Fimbriiglobus sp.]
MDHRAYHLQPSAHAAVANALRSGKLTRQPCEECGEKAQAHHDSYFPERWLDVRWLCGKHHRAWHAANEPEWPTIFDYHPSDSSSSFGLHGRPGRAGRPCRPWFRASRNCWYVTLDGKRHNLGVDRDEAHRRFEKLLPVTSESGVAELGRETVAERQKTIYNSTMDDLVLPALPQAEVPGSKELAFCDPEKYHSTFHLMVVGSIPTGRTRENKAFPTGTPSPLPPGGGRSVRQLLATILWA